MDPKTGNEQTLNPQSGEARRTWNTTKERRGEAQVADRQQTGRETGWWRDALTADKQGMETDG